MADKKPWEQDWSAPAEAPVSSAKPWEQDWSAAEPAPTTEKPIGKRIGEAAKSAPRNLYQATKDLGEVALAAGTGAVAPIIGAVTGLARKIDGPTSSKNSPVARALLPQSWIDAYDRTSSPSEAREKVMEATTYSPRSGAAKEALGAIGTVMTPITKVGRFVGDVAEGVTGSKFAGDVVSDVATGAVGYGVAKAVPRVASATVDAAKATGRGAMVAARGVKAGTKAIGEVYTPEMQQAVALGHLASGDLAGAAIQGSIGTTRKAIAARRVTPPATVADAVSPIPNVTTKAEAVAIKDIVAARRAEAVARNAASGRNVQSTM